MKIYNENCLDNIKEIINTKAKFQKVMLVYDDTVSNVLIGQIYDLIKTHCVFNKMKIDNIDKQEIFNGYKAIIYVCDTDNFLKCDFDRSEFVNIYFPQSKALLPYFLTNDNRKDLCENYLLLNSACIDIALPTSVAFNRFYNYFKNLMLVDVKEVSFSLSQEDITFYNILHSIDLIDDEFEFLDVKLLKNCKISYSYIALVDLLLIDAFLLLISSIKTQNLMLVDLYKSTRENEVMLEKFYKLYYDENFKSVIMLNYNCLHSMCLKTKQKILEYVNFTEFDCETVYETINKIKEYSKNSEGIMAYLYLYNIFNV